MLYFCITKCDGRTRLFSGLSFPLPSIPSKILDGMANFGLFQGLDVLSVVANGKSLVLI